MARPPITSRLILAGAVQLALGAFTIHYTWGGEEEVELWQQVAGGVFGALCLAMSALSFWLSTMRISCTHTLFSAYVQAAISWLMLTTRHSKVNRIRKSWGNPRQEQEDLLQKILKENRKTLYVKECGLEAVTSLQELRKAHSLTTYERYRPYIDRMAKGETGLLTMDVIERFALTSGTTGKSKMIPYPKAFLKSAFSDFIAVGAELIVTEFGLDSYVRRDINMYTAPKLRYSECGIVMGPASLIPKWFKPFLVMYTTPGAGYDISDPTDATYVHMLFGLKDRNLRGINGNFTSNLMSAMRLIESRWPDLVRDIKEGTITTKNVSPDIHRNLVRSMGGGDPERATELKEQFEEGFEGIIKRVWPHIDRVQAIDSVGIKDVLQNSYVKGVPLFGPLLGATEGIFGCNLWPRRTGADRYVLFPTTCVMEFIPEDKIMEDQPETFFIDELQVGGVYELVLTQSFGVYRFRYGDVIKVVDYHKSTPVIEFMYRSGQILNVAAEKLDQGIVMRSMEAAVNQWADVTLRDYAVAESTLLDQLVKHGYDHRPHYVIFLELDQNLDEHSLAQLSFSKVDEELRKQSFVYNSFREKGTIAPPHVHIVSAGSFERLHDYILEHSTTTANQYKVPRKLRTTGMLKLMLDSSVCASEVNSNAI